MKSNRKKRGSHFWGSVDSVLASSDRSFKNWLKSDLMSSGGFCISGYLAIIFLLSVNTTKPTGKNIAQNEGCLIISAMVDFRPIPTQAYAKLSESNKPIFETFLAKTI